MLKSYKNLLDIDVEGVVDILFYFEDEIIGYVYFNFV